MADPEMSHADAIARVKELERQLKLAKSNGTNDLTKFPTMHPADISDLTQVLFYHNGVLYIRQ